MFDRILPTDPRSVSQISSPVVRRSGRVPGNGANWLADGADGLLTLVRTSCTLVAGTHQLIRGGDVL
jgi:hypothetical protein